MKPSFYIFMSLCVILFLTLGMWQIKRLEWKESLLNEITREEQLDASKIALSSKDIESIGLYHLRRGFLKGRLDLSQAILWQGHIFDGKPTSYIVAPLYKKDHKIVPIVLAMCGADCENLKPSRKMMTIIGVAKHHKDNIFRLQNRIDKDEWYRMDNNDLALKWGGDVIDILFYSENDVLKDFQSVPVVTNLPNNHKQYAIFWFSMAILIVGMTLYRARSSHRSAN
jgi:surfeit locus 1 family protein